MKKFLMIPLAILIVAAAIFIYIKSKKPNTNSNDETQKNLDTLVLGIRKSTHLPSVVLGVFIPGKGDYVVVQGKANYDDNLNREPYQQYRIGSITKTFIGTAILQLADSGKLSTSDKLSKWFPDFPNADIITIKNLLMMRSGIYDSWDSLRTIQYYEDPLMKLTAQDMIKFASEKASEFKAPDTETKYANINFILLEEILKKITGKETNDVLNENIYKPLGLTNTIYETATGLPGNLHGYSLNKFDGKFQDKTLLNPDPVGGAGAMVSNLIDMKIYAKALYTGAGLLKPETQKERLASKPMKDIPDFIGYGEGIIKFGKFYGHNGTICGFSSEMFYLPEKDATIIVSVNRLDLDDESKSALIFQRVSKFLFPEYVNW